MTHGLVHFRHGKESGPGGSKIAALAGVAQRQGWNTASLDYSHTTDPAALLAQLLAACAGVQGARLRRCTLHLVEGNHRLNSRIPLLCELFGAFLSRCAP